MVNEFLGMLSLAGSYLALFTSRLSKKETGVQDKIHCQNPIELRGAFLPGSFVLADVSLTFLLNRICS